MNPNTLRPSTLAEFIGKRELKENLAVFIAAARLAKRPIDHCLFYGPSGTGKTSLAIIVANEMGGRLKVLQGPAVKKPADILSILSTIADGDVLFIDEIHSMDHACGELLYSAMEDQVLDITIGKELNAKTVRIKMAAFTVVGATTLLGHVPPALESRFGIVFKIDPYALEELEAIARNTCALLGLQADANQIKQLAAAARGVPRNLNRTIKRVADHVAVGRGDIGAALKTLGVSASGLTDVDFSYLQVLKNADHGHVGLTTIAQALGEDRKTIEEKVEPHLLKAGYVAKTLRGRMVTEKGLAALAGRQ